MKTTAEKEAARENFENMAEEKYQKYEDIKTEIKLFLKWHNDPHFAHTNCDYANYLKNMMNNIKD